MSIHEIKDELTVALLQTDIVWQSPTENYQAVEQMLAAVDNPLDIIVLPEMFTTAFCADAASWAEAENGATLAFAQRMAQRYDALFVASWPVIDANRQSTYNRMHLVAPEGTLATYDKHHTFRLSNEAATFARGTDRPIVEWRGWRICPAVCYDLRFPTWLRNRYDSHHDTLQYDLMIVCANWPTVRVEAWDTLLRARAIENLAYVVGVNRTGTDADGLRYDGHSAAIDAKGHYLLSPMVDKATISQVTLSHTALQNFHQRNPFYLDFD